MDCYDVRMIYPSAAVLLLAELDRALAGGSFRAQIRFRRPKDAIVDAVLKQIGLYDQLGLQCRTSKSEDESVRHWRHASGVLSEGAAGGSILEKYEGRLADGLTKGLYDGIVEAMTNTVHHAYEGVVGAALRHQIGRRWWMLSVEAKGMLGVAFCDLGIGIPQSLPQSRSFTPEFVRSVWTRLGLGRSDINAIRVALEIGKTRTGAAERGKGLNEIVEAVKLSRRGSVLISSNRGVFIVDDDRSRAEEHSHSIHGTLIEWLVPVQVG